MEIKFSVDNIIRICHRQKPFFSNILKCVNYELKGIFNSEMLLLCAVSKALGVQFIIETGRARGYSTELMARFFEDSPKVSIISVDYLRYTEDSLLAMRRLSNRYSKLTLLFGDAFLLLPKLCSQASQCTVLIDGPKGKYALQLASGLLKLTNVKAVFIHDCHKDTEIRSVIESVYPKVFSTDASEFVQEFYELDLPCWDVYKKGREYEDWGPYKRGSREMKSYGPTLTMILNAPEGIDKEKEILEILNLSPMHSRNDVVNRLRQRIRTIVPRASEIPYFFKYYAMLMKQYL